MSSVLHSSALSVKRLLRNLDVIKAQLYTMDIDEEGFDAIHKKTLSLVCEVTVLKPLQNTCDWLWEAHVSTAGKKQTSRKRQPSVREKRLAGMFEEIDVETPSIRFATLYSLGIEPFMFVAASYTSAAIKKMPEDTFSSLLDVIPQFFETKALPTDWVFRAEFQVAIARGAKSGSEFKRKYHELEYDVTGKRSRIGQSSNERIQGQGSSTPKLTGVNGIDYALEVPRGVFDTIWKDYGHVWTSNPILTIPTEDRVASAVHQIPREDAMNIGELYDLQLLPLIPEL